MKKRYRILREGELTEIAKGDEFDTNEGWVPTVRDGRLIHAGLVGAYRRPVAGQDGKREHGRRGGVSAEQNGA
jgi:hypothetical protein